MEDHTIPALSKLPSLTAPWQTVRGAGRQSLQGNPCSSLARKGMPRGRSLRPLKYFFLLLLALRKGTLHHTRQLAAFFLGATARLTRQPTLAEPDTDAWL